ncbi:SIMPL domain-containing protein [Pseudogemmobacter humi]|uniref:26 kDa periplasmic immunogenic protein n=1 Tax=Pseudogemmobacter humi TaxID=2483812 RepID=A0A3P5XMX8_9RHOB|nr:SIMPL domain-containing protein [Pseudogemmobacter humi]VDC30048.1 26 kDa periplasmic immunogenic protein precursor [Pseudogemmobacter humi]
MRMLPPLSKSLPLAALIAALMSAAPVLADTPPKTITVTGEASVARAPDMATVMIGVTSVAATAAEALAANSGDMQAVIERLRASGIGEKDMQTTGLSVNPNWTSYSSGASSEKIDGFTAMNSLTVGIRDLDALGAVLDAVVADGANTLNGVTFGLIDPGPALDEARKEAVADARARAELLAGAAGVKLGDLVSMTEGSGYLGGPAPMFREQAASVPVERGEVSYQASVTLVWELE